MQGRVVRLVQDKSEGEFVYNLQQHWLYLSQVACCLRLGSIRIVIKYMHASTGVWKATVCSCGTCMLLACTRQGPWRMAWTPDMHIAHDDDGLSRHACRMVLAFFESFQQRRMVQALSHLPSLNAPRQVIPAVIRQKTTGEDVIEISLACISIPRRTIMELDSPAAPGARTGSAAGAYDW